MIWYDMLEMMVRKSKVSSRLAARWNWNFGEGVLLGFIKKIKKDCGIYEYTLKASW